MAKVGGAPGKGAGAAKAKGGFGARGPSAKSQLVSLVTKLDVLTKTPLSVSLSNDQKAKVRTQLEGLGEMTELSQAEAKKRLDALQDLVQDQRVTLEAVGYRWPAAPSPGGGPPMNPPNPFGFKGSPDAAHLESLLETLGAKPAAKDEAPRKKGD
jgi:hypothetical protein